LNATAVCDTRDNLDRRSQITWILAVFFIVVILDQLTKAIIIHYIPENSVTFAGREEEFFFFTHQRNPGLVGGMFGDIPWVAYTAPLLATLVLVYLYRHLDPGSKWQTLAYGLIAGGALGNLIDRFFREGGVVDFLQFNFYFIPFDFPWKRYPAFNVADAAICVGVFLLLLSWRGYDPKEASDASGTV
jgi:lipoprotein signal peptidase